MSISYKSGLLALAAIAAGTLSVAFIFGNKTVSPQGAPYGLLTADAAAVDYFLKIDGIDGESKDAKHKDEIDVESWSWGATQTGTGGGGGAGKVQMQDFHFVMKTNKATPKLMLALATGQHIKDGKITVRRKERPQEYLVITFEDLIVSSYQTGGNSSNVPTDQVSFNFGKIKMSYTAPDGEVIQAGWDIAQNRPI